MKLKDFLNEFSSNYINNKVMVCRDGFDAIRFIIERDGLRGCCSYKNRYAGSFDTVWTLTWAAKEWAMCKGKPSLEKKLWTLMMKCNSGRVKGRDARWAHVRTVAKLVGITDYSHKKQKK